MADPGEDYQRWSTVAGDNGTIDSLIDWHEGQTRRSVNNSSRSELAAHAKNRNLNNGSLVTTGTKNAQAFLSGVGYATLPTGLRATLKVGSGLDNDGPLTLNCDGTGAVSVKLPAGLTECVGGEFVSDRFVDLIYNGTFWIYLYSAGNFAPLQSPVFTGDFKAGGWNGGIAFYSSVVGVTGASGYGANSQWNSGATQAIASNGNSTPGSPGGIGAGGSGAAVNNAPSSNNGGAGGAGYVVITEFIS